MSAPCLRYQGAGQGEGRDGTPASVQEYYAEFAVIGDDIFTSANAAWRQMGMTRHDYLTYDELSLLVLRCIQH